MGTKLPHVPRNPLPEWFLLAKPESLLRITEVADLLNITVTTIYDLCRRGEFPPISKKLERRHGFSENSRISM